MVRKLIWLATAVSVAAAAISFIGEGNTLGVLGEAVRRTAKVSGFFFALALIARGGFPRWFGENRVALLMAFVAAHGVHLATVALNAALDPHNSLRTLSTTTVLSVTIGFGLLLLTALTARATSGIRLRANIFGFYALWVLFVLAFFGHAQGIQGREGEPGAAALFLFLVLAMAWRIAAPFMRPQPIARAAAAR